MPGLLCALTENDTPHQRSPSSLQTEQFAVGPAVDSFYAEHAADDYGEIGKALGAAARRMFAAVEGLKAQDGNDLSVAQMRAKLDQSASNTAAKGLLARHMSLFEGVSERVQRRALLEVCAAEQARFALLPAVVLLGRALAAKQLLSAVHLSGAWRLGLAAAKHPGAVSVRCQCVLWQHLDTCFACSTDCRSGQHRSRHAAC